MNVKTFPPFKLDAVNQCLWRSDAAGAEARVPLTPKSYDLLKYLLDNAGRLVTHEELLETLWANVFVQPEVLKGHVRALRAALGDRAEDPAFVQTVRGRGYRFIGSLTDMSLPAIGGGTEKSTFVARATALAELRSLFEQAGKSQPQTVFVTGEPGIGKTALIEEFLRRSCVSPDVSLAAGQCNEGFGGTEAYYPILEALTRLCKGAAGHLALQQIMSLAPTWAVQLPSLISAERRLVLQRQIVGAARDRMLREGCELWESLASARPLILVIEDAHWADHSTVDLLSALARRRSPARLMVLVTLRSEDAARAQHPIRALYRDLAARDLCRGIALPPFGLDAIATLLSDPGQDTDFALVQLIHEQSGGNPLYAAALLKHLIARGLVERAGRGWALADATKAAPFEVPSSIEQVVEAGIERLPAAHRQALEAASVQGVIFDSRVAAPAAGTDLLAFEDICEELARNETYIGRYESSADALPLESAYAFRHAIHRQVFYARQGPLRRAQSHEKIALALEALYAGKLSEVAGPLEQHYIRAGAWSKAIAYSRMSLLTARQRFAYQEALAIFERARSLIAHLPEQQRAAADIELLEMEAATAAALHDPRARDVYERMVRRAAQAGLTDVHARALLGLAYTVSWRDQRASLELLEDALRLSDRQTDAQLQARTRISAYVWRMWVRGWDADDIRRCEDAVHSVRTTGSALAAAWPLIEYSLALFVSSRYREARETLTSNFRTLLSSPDMHPELNTARAIWMYHSISPCALTLAGEFGTALQEFDSGIEMFAENGNHYGFSTLQLYRAWFLLQALDYAGALETCGSISSSAVQPAEQRLRTLLAGLAHAGLGNAADATAALSSVERDMDHQPAILDWYWRLSIEWAFANLALLRDGGDAAQQRSDRLLELAQRSAERTWQAIAWETKARVLLHHGDLQEAAACIDRGRRIVENVEAPLAEWRLHATLAAIASRSGDDATAAENFAAAHRCRQRLIDSLPQDHRLRETLSQRSPIEPHLNAATTIR